MTKHVQKVGILTFHNSYNCGSMMQAYAMQVYLKKIGVYSEIIDFSNEGQKNLYSVLFKKITAKNCIKNGVLFFHARKIARNYDKYEEFKKRYFILSKEKYTKLQQLTDKEYVAVIAGSDQIWNVTIEDGDKAYFLPWIKKARRIAYAPSFGAREIFLYADNPTEYQSYIQRFDYLSAREDNGSRWLKKMVDEEIPVVLDPTLLLDESDYTSIINTKIEIPKRYIFYYSPGYSGKINKLVKKISKKYKLPVIAFNAKSFYLHGMNFSSFHLPKIEDPTIYLRLIKEATLVITTSFHGTVFSSIFRKNYWTIKNGEMYRDDDRILSLSRRLDLQDRLISAEFYEDFDYMQPKNYEKYTEKLQIERNYSINYLTNALKGCYEEGK